MCGIIGVTGEPRALDILIDGLRRLEYRGYDSAGVAVVGPDGLQIRRAAGRIKVLEGLLRERGNLEVYNIAQLAIGLNPECRQLTGQDAVRVEVGSDDLDRLHQRGALRGHGRQRPEEVV